MNVHPAEIVIAIQTMQALAAIVLGALLWHFHRGSGHEFLRHWALSMFALVVYLAASAGALAAFRGGPEYAGLRLALSALSLSAAYPHIVWLMIGTWEAVNQRSAGRRLEVGLISAAVALGLASALVAPFDPDAAALRSLLRIDARYLLTGVAFIVAGILLWRAQRHAGLLGAQIGADGFVLYGLQMLHIVGINVAGLAGLGTPFYAGYTGLIDFLCQTIIGLGIVVWLLELQQRRARRARHQLEHVRRHDPATGLPNRELLIEQLGEIIERTGVRRVGVISLGMNRFSRINRALGWRRTERIMRIIANRIHEAIGQRCVLGRLADRDFVIVRPTLDDEAGNRAWTERLMATLMKPLKFERDEIFVTFCAGVAMYPEDGREPETLLQHSQHALVQSARIGRDVTLYRHLDDEQSGEIEAALRFETELRRGLGEGEFELFYQPIVAVADRRISGFEALLRWNHPRHGLLAPARFLDEAASIGILDALESFAVRRALEQLREWRTRGRTGLTMAVNVSARMFQRPDLVDELTALCAELDVPPERVELEITENTALRDLPAAAGQIQALHAAGIRIALDDFGTGYSSLANLVALPVDRVKLDREFLKNVPADERQSELVAAVIMLSHRLGLEVVAEGVESAEQLEFLAGTNCEMVQGYLLQRPTAPAQSRFELESAS